jgi:hypothetical protein
MTSRPFATALALNRIAFGARFMATPAAAGKVWIGRRPARLAEAQLLTRALGARDVALGVGALAALRRRDGTERAWMLAHTLSDGTDVAATLAARGDLARRQLVFALTVAGVSTAIAGWSAATLGSEAG